MTRDLNLYDLTKTLFISIVCILFPLIFGIKAQSIKSLRGNSFDIALTAINSTIKIPIILVPDSGILNPRLVDVSFDNPVRTISPSLFAASIETDSLKNSFLNISIHNQPALDQGKYHLIFNIIKGKPTSIPEVFTIDFIVKPASIAPIANLIIFRVQEFPFLPYKPSHIPLTIFETSRNAILSPVVIRELTLTDAKGANIPVGVSFLNLDQGVAAGKQNGFDYNVIGDPSVGIVSGNFEINAPQLSTPVQFKVDIITKKGGAWIFLIILAGLLLGYATRILLDNILKLNKARKEVAELASLLDVEKQNRPDDAFGQSINNLQKTLNDAGNSNTAKISKAIADVNSGLAEAIAKFNIDMANFQTKLKSFSHTLTGIWHVPADVETALLVASTSLSKANDFIIQNNLFAGEKALENLNMELAASLMAAVVKSKNNMKMAFESIRQSSLKIAAAGSPVLKELDDLSAALLLIPEDKFDEDPANIKLLLNSLTTQRRHTVNFFFNIYLALKSLMELLLNMLSNGNIKLEEELLSIIKKSELKFVSQSNKSIDSTIISVGGDMREMQDDIVQALTSVKLGLQEDQIKIIKDLLMDGQYSDAANNIMKFKKPTIIREAFTDTNNTNGLTNQPPISFAPGSEERFIQNPVAVTYIATNKHGLSIAEIKYREIVRTIFWTSFAQTLLIGIGIAVFGYGIFAEKFNGTVADMIEIFSWAFVLDVSINTLTTTAGGISKNIRT